MNLDEYTTLHDIPFLRLDAFRARREFTEEEYPQESHMQRLAELDALALKLCAAQLQQQQP